MGFATNNRVYPRGSVSEYVLPCSAEQLQVPAIRYTNGMVPLATLKDCNITTVGMSSRNGEVLLTDVLAHLNATACKATSVSIKPTPLKSVSSEAKTNI